MRIFFSAGEPSGDIHGANLIRELQARRSDLTCFGFGGAHMAEAGCQLHYPLVNLAIMGFTRVLANASTFLRLLSQADRFFRHHRPDGLVLIDYPGFNWWMARRAKFHGIPVFYFVPPQLWAWAGWRVNKMRRFVDHVLCSLPFEKDWYGDRGVRAEYVGHPFFDECPGQRLDENFLARYREDQNNLIAILPGSRTQELEKNLGSQLRTAQRIHQARPSTRFLVACYRTRHQAMVEEQLRHFPGLPIETHLRRTPEIIELARACLTVSGSVALELLYRKKPSVIVYRAPKLGLRLASYLMTTKFICLVNLLAGQELYPEFLTSLCPAQAMADRLLTWMNDAGDYQKTVDSLTQLMDQVGQPGACARSAQYLIDALNQSPRLAA